MILKELKTNLIIFLESKNTDLQQLPCEINVINLNAN